MVSERVITYNEVETQQEREKVVITPEIHPHPQGKVPLKELYNLTGAEEVYGFFHNADMLPGKPENSWVVGEAFQEIKSRLGEELGTRIWLTTYMNPDQEDYKKRSEMDKTTVIINAER